MPPKDVVKTRKAEVTRYIEVFSENLHVMKKNLTKIQDFSIGINAKDLDTLETEALQVLDRFDRHSKTVMEWMKENEGQYDEFKEILSNSELGELYARIALAIKKRRDALSGSSNDGSLLAELERLKQEMEKLKLVKSDDSLIKQKYEMKFPKFEQRCTTDAVAYADWREMVNTYRKTFPNLQETLLTTYLKTSTVDVAQARIITQNFRGQDQGAFQDALDNLDKRFKCTRMILMQTLDRIIRLPEDLKTKKTSREKLLEIVDRMSSNMQSALNHVRQELIDSGSPNPTEDEVDLSLVKKWKSCLVLRAIDNHTLERLMSQLNIQSDIMPDFDEIMNALNTLVNASFNTDTRDTRYVHQGIVVNHLTDGYAENCSYCDNSAKFHSLDECRRFRQISVSDRWNFIKDRRICKVCLWHPWEEEKCKKEGRTCFICKKAHHELLCSKNKASSNAATANNNDKNKRRPKGKKPQGPKNQEKIVAENNASTSNAAVVASASVEGEFAPILGTAQIQVTNGNEKWHTIRAFIDEGSMINVITEAEVSRLNLQTQDEFLEVTGFNREKGDQITKIVWLTIKARRGIPNVAPLPTKVKLHVVQHLPKKLPNVTLMRNANYEKQHHIKLADQKWWIPKPVGILLGVLSSTPLKSGRLIRDGDTCYEETALGMVVRGEAEVAKNFESYNVTTVTCNDKELPAEKLSDSELQLNLEKFFNYADSQAKPDEIDQAEKIFREKTRIEEDGTYVVPFPWVDEVKLGESRNMCLARNRKAMDRVKPELKPALYSVMRTYIEKKIWVKSDLRQSGHYNPITIVHKAESLTTPIRICMDASAKSTNGRSLNDNMLTGAKLQPDIDLQIQNLRKHKIGVCADVRSMYLNAKMLPEDQVFQRTVVIWEDGRQEDYDMTTIVFGTRAAPFLANRIFKEIAYDYRESHPLGSKVLASRAYIDDVNDSYGSIEVGRETIRQLREITGKHNFPVVKWASNEPKVLQDIPEEDTLKGMDIPEVEKSNVKVLGLKWDTKNDTLQVKHKLSELEKFTKREAAGVIATIYDPCGFWAPVTLAAKSILQEIWRLEKGLNEKEKIKAWDAELPPKLNENFKIWSKDLQAMDSLKIDRSLGIEPGAKIELVTYVDASNAGYGAVTYIRVLTKNGLKTNIVQAKNHVAAISSNYFPRKKPELSIPRLEMLAAVHGAYLADKLLKGLELPKDTTKIFFSDSMVVLGQIYGEENTRSAWVERRLNKIKKVSSPAEWYHIKGTENICADMLSRGMNPEEFLKYQDDWLHGPSNMRQEVMNFPEQNITSTLELAKTTQKTCMLMVTSAPSDTHILDMLSGQKTFTRAKRIVARILKLVEKFRLKKDKKLSEFSPKITAKDMKLAEIRYLKLCQKTYFGKTIAELENGKILSGDLKGKNPILDSNGLLRLRTRLQKCDDYEYANPLVLPPLSQKVLLEQEKIGRYPIVRQILSEGHHQTNHGGPAELQAYLSQRFWVQNMRNTARMICHRCLACAKVKRPPHEQLMGDLPKDRLDTVSPPFSNIILDYAGPFEVLATTRRQSKRNKIDEDEKKSLKNKIFIVVIVCQATNAVYLDIVEDASANAFLKSWKRFVNTRGMPKLVRSDNATAFVRAAKIIEAQNAKQAIALGTAEIEGYCANQHVTWLFNPPRGPHFGGHAEVFVKLTKDKLKKSMKLGRLPVMDLLTTLKMIEGALNSRPLVKTGSKFDGDGYLTPSHFIMMRPTIIMPDFKPDGHNPSLQKRFKLHQEILKGMWQIHKPYLQHLASRAKWKTEKQNIKLNDLVILLEDNKLSPLTWKVGVVEETHPGRDGLVRVVTVRTATGQFKRSIDKLSLLPVRLNIDG